MAPSRDFSPAADRNKQPIADVLARLLPARGLVLEIASGSGQHVAHFAARFPALEWQPTERAAEAAPSIRGYVGDAALPNVREPLVLDAAAGTWPIERADAIVNINMIHISPWAACLGLLAGAARTLPVGGVLFIYGPYKIDGAFHAPSNARFDESLRGRDPAWGVRDLRDVERAAAPHGLVLDEVVDMPANNYSVVFTRA